MNKVSTDPATSYQPVRKSESQHHRLRGLNHHVTCWPAAGGPSQSTRTLWLLHGWMDVGASFQFVVDALPPDWTVLAPDWRGFGQTGFSGTDSYWFPDYLGDFDALADKLSPDAPLDLVGHSMGGNLTTIYAGVRPERVRRLVNLEGMGMRETKVADAPQRLAQWLDELKQPRRLKDYESLDAVAARLKKNNPRLTSDKAAFMAQHWSTQNSAGRYELQADPQHKVVNPYLYRVDETDACWAAITAPMLLVVSEHRNRRHDFIGSDAYQQRLANIRGLQRTTVADAGHMMHHDQPEAVAKLIRDFIQ